MDGENPVLAWSAAGGIVLTTYDGSSFATPLHVVDGTFSQQVTLALGNDRAHIEWTDFAGPGTTYDAADLPLTSTTADPLAMSPASYDPRIAADDAHHVAITWQVNDSSDGWGFRYTTSSDGGGTSGMPVMLDPLSTCDDVAYVDGSLVLVWVDGSFGDEQLLAAASSDNGGSFGSPVILATSTHQLRCHVVADSGAGTALIAFENGAPADARSANVVRYTPATNSAEPIVELAAPEESEACLTIATSPATGKAVVARSRGHSFATDWVTELYTSDDAGTTFDAPTTVDVIDSDQGCPAVGYASSGDVHLAWTRDRFTLEWSQGRRKRPCE